MECFIPYLGEVLDFNDPPENYYPMVPMNERGLYIRGRARNHHTGTNQTVSLGGYGEKLEIESVAKASKNRLAKRGAELRWPSGP